MHVRPTEKLFLMVNPQKNWIFLSLYFCGYFSEGTPSEKYFSDGIHIFLCVFAHTEKRDIPVVIGQTAKKHVRDLDFTKNSNNLFHYRTGKLSLFLQLERIF